MKKASRLSKIVELRVKGLTLEQIAAELKCSEKTVRRSLKDEPIQEFIDALLQAQLADIAGANTGTRLLYRDKLLEKMMPKKVEQKYSGEPAITVKVWRPEEEKTSESLATDQPTT